MRLRVAAAVVPLALLAAGCSEQLGRQIPECDLDEVRAEIITQAQAVPTATFGPCIIDLKTGWEYGHQEAESGSARFWLSSDRMGHDFVEIALTPSCNTDGATPRSAPRPDLEAFVDGTPFIEPVEVTLVPVNDRVAEYAAAVGADLAGTVLKGRSVRVRLAPPGDASAQITRARIAGRMVIVVDDADAAGSTVELLLPDGDVEEEITVEDAIEEMEDEVAEATYRATWYFTFEGGCISWAFDAAGEEVASIESDIAAAVGFYDLAEVRRVARDLGFNIGPDG